MYRQSIIWTASMVDFLIDHYKEMSNTVLAEHLGISLSCLRRKLHELGLRKHPVRWFFLRRLDQKDQPLQLGALDESLPGSGLRACHKLPVTRGR